MKIKEFAQKIDNEIQNTISLDKLTFMTYDGRNIEPIVGSFIKNNCCYLIVESYENESDAEEYYDYINDIKNSSNVDMITYITGNDYENGKFLNVKEWLKRVSVKNPTGSYDIKIYANDEYDNQDITNIKYIPTKNNLGHIQIDYDL